MKSFEGSFRNLNFSPSTRIFLNFFFPFIDIRCFFSSLKLQYCRTIVLLINLSLFKETSLSKATMIMRFPAKKNTGCPKAPRDFPPRKDGILHTPSGCLKTPLPLHQSLYGRAYADVTTKISRIDRLTVLFTHVLHELHEVRYNGGFWKRNNNKLSPRINRGDSQRKSKVKTHNIHSS